MGAIPQDAGQSSCSSDEEENEHACDMWRNLNDATVEEVLAVKRGPKGLVASRLVDLRERNGQYLSWEDLRSRVKGVGPDKQAALEAAGYGVLPTVQGLLHALDGLSVEALTQRRLASATVARIVEVRAERKSKPLPSPQQAKRQLKAAAWRDAVACLLGDPAAALCQGDWPRLLVLPQRFPAALEVNGRAQHGGGMASAPAAEVRAAEAARAGGGAEHCADAAAQAGAPRTAGAAEDEDDRNNSAAAEEGAVRDAVSPNGDADDELGAVNDEAVDTDDVSDNDGAAAAAAPVAVRWWDKDANAPFPSEFKDPQPRDKTAWRYLNDYIDEETRLGVAEYRGQDMTPQEAEDLRREWREAYHPLPNANKGGNGRESVQQRGATSNDDIRKFCWDDLKLYRTSYRKIPSTYRKKYRVDPYGNVVSLSADKSGAVCSFQADHLFPWSRGGLTVRENLVALHWRANLLKGNSILNANERNASGRCLVDRLHTGLSVEQLLGFISIREEQESRNDKHKFDRALDMALCRSYALPWTAGDGTPILRTLEPGWQTLDFLFPAAAASMVDLFGRVRPLQLTVVDSGQAGPGCGGCGAGAEVEDEEEEVACG